MKTKRMGLLAVMAASLFVVPTTVDAQQRPQRERRDRIEDRVDRREDIRDRREDVADRREDQRDADQDSGLVVHVEGDGVDALPLFGQVAPSLRRE